MITSKIRRSAPYSSMFAVSQVECVHSVEKEDTKGNKKLVKEKVTIDIVSFNGQVDKRGIPLVLNVDQFSGKPFCLNAQGFPMNDIMMYEGAQSASFAETVLRRINVLYPDAIDQNLTPEQMFEQIVPANWSSPAEFVRASKILAQKWYAHNRKQKDTGSDPDSDPDVINFSDPDSKTVE